MIKFNTTQNVHKSIVEFFKINIPNYLDASRITDKAVPKLADLKYYIQSTPIDDAGVLEQGQIRIIEDTGTITIPLLQSCQLEDGMETFAFTYKIDFKKLNSTEYDIINVDIIKVNELNGAELTD